MRTLFYTDIRGLDGKLERAIPLLSQARAKRVNSLKVHDDKLRCAASGLLLRAALGITDSALCHTPLGKPYCPNSTIEFNLSHGGNLAVLAVSDRPVGVDTEPLSRAAKPEVLSRILTEKEASCLNTSEIFTFPALWTRKEAVMKACGKGLSLAPNSFEVLADFCKVQGNTYQLSTCFILGQAVSIAEARNAPLEDFSLQELPIETLL